MVIPCIRQAVCPYVRSSALTVLHAMRRQVFHVATPLNVLPDLKICGVWVEQVCNDLVVDLQHAALATEGEVLMALHDKH